MTPIGASSTWHWEAYDNAWVDIEGRWMKSVTGGGHFGGGMFISAYDMARFGYLFFQNGKWSDRQLISRDWIDMAKSPDLLLVVRWINNNRNLDQFIGKVIAAIGS